MMKQVFLAFDLGASSGRGILGTFAGGRLELAEIHRFPNGPVERDGHLYWDFDALVREIKTGIGKALQLTPDIAGIALDTWGVDYALFDRTSGKLKRQPFNYRDGRTAKAVPEVFAKISREALYRRSGIQFMQLNTLYQLVAHHDEFPQDFDHAELLMIPDALMRALGGDATSEYTECSTSNLLDPASRNWDWELIDLLGLPREVFPRIVAPGTPGGQLSPELCREFGCAPIPIFKVGSHDTASAVGAVPAPEKGSWAYVSCGTWALLGAEIAAPVRCARGEQAPFTNEGGLDGKIRFLTNIMGSWLFQETRRFWKENGCERSFADMEKMALAAPAGRFLIDPSDSEFLAPGNMPERIRNYCRQTGQGDIPDDGALLRTIYDSLALVFAHYLAELEAILDIRCASLNLVGGGTKDALLMQLAADAINRPAVAGPVEATAIGNLLAQGMAAGVIADLAAAREVVKKSFELQAYQPDPAMAGLYDELRPRFAALLKK